MIDPGHFLGLVIRPTLKDLGLWSPAAERLLLGTALVESGLRHLKQIEGPALGVYQIEPATLVDLYRKWLAYREAWERKLAAVAVVDQHPSDQLVTNLAYATAVARLIYYRRPEPLPDPENLAGLARYWKQYFNTPEGAGDPAKFVFLMRPLWFGPVLRDRAITAPLVALRPSTPMPAGFRVQTPPQWIDFLERYPDQAATSAARVDLTAPRLRELLQVSAHVRKDCAYKRDPAGNDNWRIMLDGQEGDCEDSVLTVLARLVALGWPIGALRPAICTTQKGEGHMVLCIHTKGQGVYVRDNRFNHIAPWAELPYEWLARLDGQHWLMPLPKT